MGYNFSSLINISDSVAIPPSNVASYGVKLARMACTAAWTASPPFSTRGSFLAALSQRAVKTALSPRTCFLDSILPVVGIISPYSAHRVAHSRSDSDPSATASTSPTRRASADPTIRPVVMACRDQPKSHRRGNRCVPPAPGIRPMFTSGNPSLDLGRHTR